MKRNHLSIILGMALIALLMGSCDALFENQFGNAGLGQPTTAELAEQAASSDPVVAQPALALLVEAELDEANATPLITNLVDVLLTQGSTLDSTSMDSFLGALVPDTLLDNPGDLADAIDAIEATLANLSTLAGTVTGDSYEVEGLNTQNLAMTAALATIFDALDPGPGYGSVGEALEAFINDPAASPDINDYLAASSVDFDTLFADGSDVAILFGAAGVDFGEFNS